MMVRQLLRQRVFHKNFGAADEALVKRLSIAYLCDGDVAWVAYCQRRGNWEMWVAGRVLTYLNIDDSFEVCNQTEECIRSIVVKHNGLFF